MPWLGDLHGSRDCGPFSMEPCSACMFACSGTLGGDAQNLPGGSLSAAVIIYGVRCTARIENE